MKSAEFRVLSAEMKDRPQGAGYQPPNELLIPLNIGRGFYHSAKVLSTLLTQHSTLRTEFCKYSLFRSKHRNRVLIGGDTSQQNSSPPIPLFWKW